MINTHRLGLRKGFTLVELLVVISILSVMVSFVVVTINPMAQFRKANDARRKGNLAEIQKALETYYQDTGRYPTSASNRIVGIPWGSNWSPYMIPLPKDPRDPSRNYAYWTDAAGQSYRLYASLEQAGDSGMCNNGAACANLPGGVTCGGTCNYGVTSPNVSP